MKTHFPLLKGFTLLALLIYSLPQANAQQLPSAELTGLFPAGGQQGTVVAVTLTGKDLDGATTLSISHAGITAKPKQDASGQPVPNQFEVTIGKDVPVGFYDVRLGGGKYGTTNVRTFAVGDLPEKTSNGGTSLENAAEVAVGTLINGQAPSRNYAYYKVALKKGQRVLVHCLAPELDSQLEPVLILKGEHGLELERSRSGQLLDFTPVADGHYYVGLHDFVYGGGAGHVFRLSVSERPHIDFIVPPAGEAGKSGKYTLYGRNLPAGADSGMVLDGKPLQKQEVTIALPADSKARESLAGSAPVGPAQAGFDGIGYRLTSPKGSSNPVRIFFADAPVIGESAAANDSPDQAQKVTVPCDIAGLFYPYRDRDWVTFDAKKGDIYWIEVVSERLGVPTNPYFRVERVTQTNAGEEKISMVKEMLDNPLNIGGDLFNTTTMDPNYRFAVPEDGTYRMVTYDLYNSGAPNSLYRLSIRKEAPDFRLIAMVQGAPALPNKAMPLPSSFMRRGQVIPIKVMAYRRDGFNEPIEVTLGGLPAGLAVTSGVIPAGANETLVMVQAKPDAPAWSGTLTVSGKATINGKPVLRTARTADITSVSYDTQSKRHATRARLTGGLHLTVTDRESSPVVLAPKEDKVWEHSVFGSLKIPITATGEGGFKDVEKNVMIQGHPTLARFKVLKVVKGKTAGEIDLNLATYKLPVGEHILYLHSQVAGKYKRVTDEELKQAKDAATAADKAAKDAKAAYDALAKNKDAAEDAKKAAKDRSDAAAAAKKSADDLVKKLTPANKEANLTASFFSQAIRVKVTDSPVDFKPRPPVTIKPGEKGDLKLVIARKYEFADELTLSVKAASGITVAAGKIAKGQSEGNLAVTVAKTAQPGEYQLELTARMRLNNQNITVTQPVAIKVAAAQ